MAKVFRFFTAELAAAQTVLAAKTENFSHLLEYFILSFYMTSNLKSPQILVIDLGSQYSLVISRTLRELGARSVILSNKKAEQWLVNNHPKGIILSGGSSSVYDADAPSLSEGVLSLDVPILGICYGMQWLAKHFGGEIAAQNGKKEYGKTVVDIVLDDILFSGLNGEQTVWASHGDSVMKLPDGFKPLAYSGFDKTIAGMSNTGLKIWGLQFHPEVVETKPGKNILKNFLKKICHCENDWNPENIIDGIREEVRNECSGKAIIGFSGGVDSSVLSAIISPVFKENLLAICIDTGALRENELDEIKENASAAGVNLKIVSAADKFYKQLSGISHAEEKRKAFKKLYGNIFEEEARDFGAQYIAQGSLATDFIESGAVGEAALIKSHHNIGLNLEIKELHPLRNLFKYEVRDLARAMDLPKTISERQPFPGPGLFIRVIGTPPDLEKIDIVRWADFETRKILEKYDLYKDVSQLIVALNCVPTVGIKGDGRVYAYSVIVRAVKTSDFMTAKGYQFPPDVRTEIMKCITKHPKIVRVLFDENDKPPATTEFE